MARRTVEFETHKTAQKQTEVEFMKRDGTPVDFMANKRVTVTVHVKFTAKDKASISDTRIVTRSRRTISVGASAVISRTGLQSTAARFETRPSV